MFRLDNILYTLQAEEDEKKSSGISFRRHIANSNPAKRKELWEKKRKEKEKKEKKEKYVESDGEGGSWVDNGNNTTTHKTKDGKEITYNNDTGVVIGGSSSNNNNSSGGGSSSNNNNSSPPPPPDDEDEYSAGEIDESGKWRYGTDGSWHPLGSDKDKQSESKREHDKQTIINTIKETEISLWDKIVNWWNDAGKSAEAKAQRLGFKSFHSYKLAQFGYRDDRDKYKEYTNEYGEYVGEGTLLGIEGQYTNYNPITKSSDNFSREEFRLLRGGSA